MLFRKCNAAPGVGEDQCRGTIRDKQEEQNNIDCTPDPFRNSKPYFFKACIILKPDGIDHFTIPAEFAEEDPDYYDDEEVKADILDRNIWWFRD